MGARYGYRYKLSAQSFTKMQSQSIDVGVQASYSGAFSVSGGLNVGTSNSNSQSFSNSVSETKIFSVGSSPPVDNSGTTWANNAIVEPMPISYSFRPIMDIFHNSLFNLKQISSLNVTQLTTELDKAYYAYCEDYLLPGKFVTTCSPPGADPTMNACSGFKDVVQDASNGGCYIVLKNKNNKSTYKSPSPHPFSPSDSDVVTIWTKLRIDPATLRVDTSDFQYAASTGYVSHIKTNNPDRIPWARAFGCQGTSIYDGTAVIDLSGTAWAIDGNQTWNHAGNSNGHKITFDAKRQVVSMAGGGACGWVAPSQSMDEQTAHRGGPDVQLKYLG